MTPVEIRITIVVALCILVALMFAYRLGYGEGRYSATRKEEERWVKGLAYIIHTYTRLNQPHTAKVMQGFLVWMTNPNNLIQKNEEPKTNES